MTLHRFHTAAIKVVPCCIFVVLISLASLGTTPASARRQLIKAGLLNGSVGALKADERSKLDKILGVVAEVAGIEDKIPLNGDPYFRGLKVYSTTPASSKFTHCTQGNAVYDPQLDAVFIDLTLIRPEMVVDVQEKKDYIPILSFHDVYLCFVLLHELGHREKHHRNSGFFDSQDKDRRGTEETEADLFAFRQYVKNDARLTKAMGISEEFLPSNFIRFGEEDRDKEPKPLPEPQRGMVNLAVAMRLMCDISVLWESPYSSFYRDATHPHFIDRCLRIVTEALNQPNLDPLVQENLKNSREHLERYKEALANIEFSVLIPESIDSAWFGSSELILLGRSGAAYSLPLKGRKGKGESVAPKRIVDPQVAIGRSLADAIWGESSQRLVGIDWEGFIWKTVDGHWVRDAPGHRLRSGVTGEKAFQSDLPGKVVVQLQGTQGRTEYVAMDGTTILAYSDKESLLKKLLKNASCVGADDLALNRVIGDTAYFEAYAHRKLLGILSLDVRTFSGDQYYPVVSPGINVEGSPFTKIAVLEGGRKPKIVMVTTNDDKLKGEGVLAPRGWSAWELRAGRVPEKISEPDQSIKSFYLFNTKVYNTGLNDTFDSLPVSGNSIYFSFDSESAYVLDVGVSPPRPSRIFHPGQVSCVTGLEGFAFLYRPMDSPRGYLVRMPKPAETLGGSNDAIETLLAAVGAGCIFCLLLYLVIQHRCRLRRIRDAQRN